jgi:hypothetical protein
MRPRNAINAKLLYFTAALRNSTCGSPDKSEPPPFSDVQSRSSGSKVGLRTLLVRSGEFASEKRPNLVSAKRLCTRRDLDTPDKLKGVVSQRPARRRTITFNPRPRLGPDLSPLFLRLCAESLGGGGSWLRAASVRTKPGRHALVSCPAAAYVIALRRDE